MKHMLGKQKIRDKSVSWKERISNMVFINKITVQPSLRVERSEIQVN